MTDENPVPTKRRRRMLLAAGMGLVVVAATVGGIVWLRKPASPRHEVAAPSPIVEATTPAPAPTPAPPRRNTPPHDYVAPAVPTHFRLAGRGFVIRAHVCAMAPVFPLDPPGDQHHTVCWVTKGFGVRPGSHTATSYVLGHSWAPDPQEVLNQASERATRDVLRTKARMLDGVPVYPAKSLLGSRITLWTPRGELVYAVRNSFGVDKLKLGEIERIMNPKIPNRVVLITCAELNGIDYNYNIVLDARLVSSHAAATEA